MNRSGGKEGRTMSFTHLHVHTEYSLLDGVCRIGPVLSAAKALGQDALAITDHGVMFGAIDFYKEAKKQGVKPIIGCEVYVASRSRHSKVHELDSERYHLILLCENNTGYQNLISMVSESWVTGFYTKPRVDRELLEKYHEGLIALSGCLAGEIPTALRAGDYERAEQAALWYRDTFGARSFFIEIQNHGLGDELSVLPKLIDLSRRTGIPLVATNDTHYVKKEDSRIQQVAICIQTNKRLGENTGLEFETNEFYLKSEDEMRSLFADVPQAVDNTALIASRCNVEIEFGNTKLPHFDVPDGIGHLQWFRQLCEHGLQSHFDGEVPPAYSERLNYEIGVIDKMGYVDYFLIVHDFVRYAKSKGIPVGPGRGSGAGSLAAYSIGITGIDPLRYNLLFERFLNPERVSMPDFDIDFCYERRGEVIDYVIEKYGYDHVAQIITFGTLAARAAVRDAGRAMGIAYSTVDAISKQIPFRIHGTIEQALAESSELRTLYESNPQVKELLDTAKSIEGMPRHASKHAAGVVITRDPVSSYVPLALSDESVVTQYTMTTLEELGLLKMDFLGLRTLTAISDAQKFIRKSVPDFDIEKIPHDDPETFAMLGSGLTEGVFQFESGGMKSILMGLKPENVEDLIAVISLYRPGPMDSIPRYIENRHHPEKVTYKTPLLKDILDVTYGCLVYQEQVMQVFRTLAGYSYGRADIVRRAMSKKKHEVMQRERQNFIHGIVREDGTVECEGAVKRGVPEQTANEIFDEMTSFASYAFNKSHAAAYAVVAYRTAWLKCRYPAEFMAALLSSVLDDSGKVSGYIAECRRIGIEVCPPGVNSSQEGFTVDGGAIRFGLLAVKNLGRGFIRVILSQRAEGGNYTSFFNFCKRTYGREFNRRAVESLVLCGALDGLGANRRQMLMMLPAVIAEVEASAGRSANGQIGFFDLGSEAIGEAPEPEIPSADEMPQSELLAREKDVLGLYLSGHPMSHYAEVSKRLSCDRARDLLENDGSGYRDSQQVRVLGIIADVKKKNTKNNETMAFLTVEDESAAIEVIVFPKTYNEHSLLLREGSVVLVCGRLSLREDEEAKVVCEVLENGDELDDVHAAENKKPKKQKKCLFLRVKSENSSEYLRVRNLLDIFEDGDVPCRFYFEDKQKYSPVSRNGVFANEPLLRELKAILGEENVVFRE